MRSNFLIGLGAALFITLAVLNASVFIVTEGTQALLFQFGEIVGTPKTESGWYLKIPIIQKVVRLEKRILNWDGVPERIPTLDKKYISVDTTARWQIVDPLLFRKRLETVDRAQSRIKNVIDSATRDVVSSHNLVETVRNTNAILDEVREKDREKNEAEQAGTLDMLDEEITGEIPTVLVGREELSRKIMGTAAPLLKEFGISLVDVQLRRIAYEESVQDKVYDRMISERIRIAERIRSVGKGEQAKISGKRDKQLQKIRSEAYRKVQEIKGKAEAEAIRIYAGAMGQDPDFYRFWRTLEVYRKGLRDDTSLILSASSDFLRLLREGQLGPSRPLKATRIE